MEVKGVRGGREGRGGSMKEPRLLGLEGGTPKRSEWYRKDGFGCWRNALFVGAGEGTGVVRGDGLGRETA